MEPSPLTLEAFQSCLGEGFEVRFPDAVFTLVLDEAEPLTGPATRGSNFSLVFKSDPGLYLPQAIYALEHLRLGRLEMFLVPVKPDQRGSLFQAVFN